MLRRGIIRENASALAATMRATDILAIVLAGLAAFWWRFGDLDLPSSYQIALLVAALVVPGTFSFFGLYQSWRGRSRFLHLHTLTMAWGSVLLLLIVVAFLTKTSAVFSRQWAVAWAASGWVILILMRMVLGQGLRLMRERGWNHKRLVIVGAGALGRDFSRRLSEAAWTGLDVIGFFDDDPGLHGLRLDGVPVVGSPDTLARFVADNQVDEVCLALPLRAEHRVKEILHSLRHSTVTIRYVPDIFGFRLLNHSVTEIAGVAVLDLSGTRVQGVGRLVKELEDRLLAVVILALLSPLMLLIALGVKLSSPGPVLFRQVRHGWDGRPIVVYKFRTMTVHEEPTGVVTQASRFDVRTTRFGRLLRRTSLDELPQFFNVLGGSMSIVGPRPHAVEHNEMYKDQIIDYMKRHKMKPGITGWAQVNGWRGETDTLDKMRKRIEYDLFYIENWSLWFDVKIMLLTLFVGLINRNAY